MANLSVDQVLAEAKRRGINPAKYEAVLRQKFGQSGVPEPQEAQSQNSQAMPVQKPQSQGVVIDLLNKINPSGALSSTVGRMASGYMAGAGIKTPEMTGQDDLSKLYAQEAIKKQFEDPTVRQLREAEIRSLDSPLPEGLTRVGRQVVADPTYIKPKEQAEMEENERVKQAESESIRSTAEQNLQSIQKAKEGSEFFGPLGNLPSIAAPNSMLGFGKYPERKEWENNINKLLSQKVVDLIAEMKRVSKTGATGFGQLSEQEGALLRNASTALSRDLPPEQAVYYLNEMEKINQRILSGGQPQVDSQTSQPTGQQQVGRFIVEEA